MRIRRLLIALVSVSLLACVAANASGEDRPRRFETKSKAKNAEHGGFSEDDAHIALLVADGRDKAHTIKVPVETAQIAPTLLWMLGLDPAALQAVRNEGTAVLPGLEVDDQE